MCYVAVPLGVVQWGPLLEMCLDSVKGHRNLILGSLTTPRPNEKKALRPAGVMEIRFFHLV